MLTVNSTLEPLAEGAMKTDDRRPDRELALLVEGRIELLGRILHSSNATFLVQLSCGDDSASAVLQTRGRGTAALGFEPGLYQHERAAYLLSEYLGWAIVPPTVIRQEGPLGVGSL